MGAPGDEPAWTFVTSKRNRHSGKKPSRPATVLGCNAAPPPRRTTAHLSVEKIRSDHKKFSQQWSDSEGCRKFKDLLERMPCSDLPRKAICLGLGSFDPEDGSWQVRKRSHVQLAAFRTLVECIATADAPADAHLIRCIFQEPCFTAADKEYLESLGYEVVESPRGFEEVSEDSILFGIHLYRDIYSAAIAKAMPTMFIGTGYDVWDSYADANDTTWDSMKHLHDSCDRVPFPDDKDFYPTFSNTTIHWRKPLEGTVNDLSNAVGSLSISKTAE